MKIQPSLRELIQRWFETLGTATSVSTWPYRTPSHAEIEQTIAAFAHARAALRRPVQPSFECENCCCALACC